MDRPADARIKVESTFGDSLLEPATISELKDKTTAVLATVGAVRSLEPTGPPDDRWTPEVVTFKIDEQFSGAALPPSVSMIFQWQRPDGTRVVIGNRQYLEAGDQVVLGLIKVPATRPDHEWGSAGEAVYKLAGQPEGAVVDNPTVVSSELDEALADVTESEAREVLSEGG